MFTATEMKFNLCKPLNKARNKQMILTRQDTAFALIIISFPFARIERFIVSRESGLRMSGS